MTVNDSCYRQLLSATVIHDCYQQSSAIQYPCMLFLHVISACYFCMLFLHVMLLLSVLLSTCVIASCYRCALHVAVIPGSYLQLLSMCVICCRYPYTCYPQLLSPVCYPRLLFPPVICGYSPFRYRSCYRAVASAALCDSSLTERLSYTYPSRHIDYSYCTVSCDHLLQYEAANCLAMHPSVRACVTACVSACTRAYMHAYVRRSPGKKSIIRCLDWSSGRGRRGGLNRTMHMTWTYDSLTTYESLTSRLSGGPPEACADPTQRTDQNENQRIGRS